MWEYVICTGIWMAFIFGWLIPAIRKHVAHGIYAALGLGICFTAIILGNAWQLANVYPLPVIASVLSMFAFLLFILSFTGLKHRGKPTKGWEDTTAMVGTGVYRVVRHPMYLAGALWAIACILAFRSIPLIILGAISFYCLWMASKEEDKFNIKKFGDNYKEYMKKVPMWNIFKGLRSLREGE